MPEILRQLPGVHSTRIGTVSYSEWSGHAAGCVLHVLAVQPPPYGPRVGLFLETTNLPE